VSGFLLVLTVLSPFSLVMLWPFRPCRTWVGRLFALAPLPAIGLAACADDLSVDFAWLLLGSRWGLDATGRVFLAFTALLWLAAGVFAQSYLAADTRRDRFQLWYLLTLTGNLGVITSHDMISFLLFFTLMSFAAYGLITHDRRPESMRAGRTYIVLAVFGEILLFWAAVLAAHETNSLYFDGLAAKLAMSPLRNLITGLLLVGFGIKLGAMPLHFWLPLAHPAAPVPASAVLSGAIIKTGLLGLFRFLPLGAVALPEWGATGMVVGMASAFLAVALGLPQHDPKTVLAYSSVSQMGLLILGIGVSLIAPAAWREAGAALLLFATHHALAKAALFLGVGVARAELRSREQRIIVTTGLFVAGLSLAGLPLTSGYAAKMALKYSVASATEPWATVLAWTLPLTGLTTTLLVTRFLWLVWPQRQAAQHALTISMAIPWALLTLGVVALYMAMLCSSFAKATWVSVAPAKLWAAAWPMLAAGIVLLIVRSQPALMKRLQRIRIPAGDLVVPLARALVWCRGVWHFVGVAAMPKWVDQINRTGISVMSSTRNVLSILSRTVESDLVAGFLIGLLAVVIFGLALL
jgi:formate hydrogenlyase subunit 3/multisubunit Na+/H+ antiporter MnhD subunit